MNAARGTGHAGHPLYRVASIIQWVLPLCLFVIAVSYESTEHLIFGGALSPRLAFWGEVAFFGVLGPVSVALALMLVRALLKRQIEAQKEVVEANRELESRVAERTRHLEEARAELQQNLRALGLANAELRQLDQMKSDFVALVSHSFRAPLTNLNGALEVIAQDSLSMPEKARGTLAVLAEEGNRLQRLVNTILDLSRLEGGQMRLNPGPVAMEPLLRRAVDAAQPVGSERPVVVDVPRPSPPAWADEVCVEEVFHNLMSNAARYSPPGSPIRVSVGVAGDALEVSVTDHSPGVHSGDRSHIFQPFRRTEEGRRKDTAGLGLGLHIASKLVEAQGGRIWVESPVWPDPSGPGARFTFTLPVAAEVPGMEEAGLWPGS